MSVLVLYVALASQTKTVPSTFLALGDSIYEASPIYAVKAASPDERLVWSVDGTRLATVSTLGAESPKVAERRIARGEVAQAPLRVGVWSRDSGQFREVLVPANPMTSINAFAFVGRTLLVVAGQVLWSIPDGGTAVRSDLPVEGAIRLLPSSKSGRVLVVDNKRMWLMDANRTTEIKGSGDILYGRGVTADDRAVVRSGDVTFLVDLATGKLEVVNDEPVAIRPQAPFILDLYALSGGSKATLIDEDEDAARVDSNAVYVSEEDGGFRLDLVERQGEKRRRLRFIPEMSRFVEVSGNGLSYAYLSHRTVMVRWLVKLDAATTKKRLGT